MFKKKDDPSRDVSFHFIIAIELVVITTARAAGTDDFFFTIPRTGQRVIVETEGAQFREVNLLWTGTEPVSKFPYKVTSANAGLDRPPTSRGMDRVKRLSSKLIFMLVTGESSVRGKGSVRCIPYRHEPPRCMLEYGTGMCRGSDLLHGDVGSLLLSLSPPTTTSSSLPSGTRRSTRHHHGYDYNIHQKSTPHSSHVLQWRRSRRGLSSLLPSLSLLLS